MYPLGGEMIELNYIWITSVSMAFVSTLIFQNELYLQESKIDKFVDLIFIMF